MNPPAVILIILAALVAIPLGVIAVVYLIVPVVKAIVWAIRHVFQFIFGMLGDALHLVGTVITTVVLIPLTIGNIMIGRWSASAHYGRAIQGELKALGRCCYRIVIGHPARLLCLSCMTEGIEKRLPEVVAAAPGPDRPNKRVGQFDGYKIVGSLQGGGSGGKLYVAEPSPVKLAGFVRNGDEDVDRVVIKCFSLGDGSSLPQIVRENRALDAAKRLGLILEHDLTNDRFYYVMRYVPGESLNLVTQRLHAQSGGAGLAKKELRDTLEYGCDLLRTLCHYHAGGLWHKDVKPDNIIVHDGQAHLVDFGLITPLRSSMTLTTHGTEYFRDPEMVRMALKGVKVNDVDGAKFDVYAAGAVMYSMIENSFPAHGGLSQISRPCPEAVRWVVRRAMTDYDKRYESAAAMLADLEAVLASADPFAMKPVELPSMRGDGAGQPMPAVVGVQAAAFGPFGAAASVGAWDRGPARNAVGPEAAPAGSPAGVGYVPLAAGSPVPSAPGKSVRPRPGIHVTDWWRGSYVVEGAGARAPAGAPPVAPPMGAPAGVQSVSFGQPAPAPAFAPRAGGSGSASEQLKRARDRAHAARQRAQERMHRRKKSSPSGLNAGIGVAVLLFVGVCVLLGTFVLRTAASRAGRSRLVISDAVPTPPMPPVPVSAAQWSSGTAREIAQAKADAREAARTAAEIAQSWIHADGQRVMVVCEWSKFEASERQAIISQLKELTDAGFVLTGDTGAAEDPDVAREHTEAVAELRKALGTRVIASEDAATALRKWLDSSEKADLVLWIGALTDGPDAQRHSSWLVPSSNTDTPVVSLARGVLEGR